MNIRNFSFCFLIAAGVLFLGNMQAAIPSEAIVSKKELSPDQTQAFLQKHGSSTLKKFCNAAWDVTKFTLTAVILVSGAVLITLADTANVYRLHCYKDILGKFHCLNSCSQLKFYF